MARIMVTVEMHVALDEAKDAYFLALYLGRVGMISTIGHPFIYLGMHVDFYVLLPYYFMLCIRYAFCML